MEREEARRSSSGCLERELSSPKDKALIATYTTLVYTTYTIAEFFIVYTINIKHRIFLY